MSPKKLISIFLLFIVLTAITQIGGIVLLCTFFLNQRINAKFKGKNLSIFLSIYLLSTYVLVPMLSSRERVASHKNIKPTSYISVLLNRNYVNSNLNIALVNIADELKKENISLVYLDANFPFFDGFPLLPHLSHNDGQKIDLSFVYENESGLIVDEKKSRLGYGVFESPKPSEFNQTERCIDAGYFQYDYPKYFTLGEINQELIFSEKGTKQLIKSVLNERQIGKLFIEPHLKTRLNLTDKRIRFHGCKAVRHDDHIHIQLR